MANYTMRADGTAANKAAAVDGDPAVVAECMNVSVHNGETFSAGDVIMLADTGGDYRSTLYFRSHGTSGNRIVYEAYSGDTPVINGSDLVVAWSDEGDDIWSATLTTEPQQVWMDGTFGDRQEDLISCVNEYDWFWESNVLYVFAASDPDARYASPGVEADQRQFGINTESYNYTDIDGITVVKCNQWNLYAKNSSNITIKNCITEWGWLYGILQWQQTTDTTNVIIEDNIARYCGQGGIGVSAIQTSSLTNCITRRNKAYENGRHQWHDPYWTANHTYTGGIKVYADHKACTGVEISENECYTNGPNIAAATTSQRGNGIWVDEFLGIDGDPVIVKHNICYDNWGSGIFLENSSWNVVFGNVIYDCAFGSDESNPFSSGGIKCMSRNTFVSSNNVIANNTIYDCFIGIQAATYLESAGCEYDDNTFKNNICDGCTIALRTEDGAANDTWGTGNVYENNCFGAEASGFLEWDTVAYSTYAAFKTAHGESWDQVGGDPLLTDPGNGDLTLTSGSPCIGAGTNLGSPFNEVLMPSSIWPDGVVTGDQDDY